MHINFTQKEKKQARDKRLAMTHADIEYQLTWTTLTRKLLTDIEHQ